MGFFFHPAELLCPLFTGGAGGSKKIVPTVVRPGEVVMVPLWCCSVERFLQRVFAEILADIWSLNVERDSTVERQYLTVFTTIHIIVRTRK